MRLKIVLHYHGPLIIRCIIYTTYEIFSEEIMPGFVLGISDNFLQGEELDYLVRRLRQTQHLFADYSEPFLANILLNHNHVMN